MSTRGGQLDPLPTPAGAGTAASAASASSVVARSNRASNRPEQTRYRPGRPSRSRRPAPAATRSVVRAAGEGRPRRQPDDPQPVAPHVEQSPGGPRRRLAPDDDGRRVAQDLGTEPLPEPAGHGPPERVRELPRREIEQRDDDGQPGRDRQRAATHRVIDGAGRAATVRVPGGADRRATQDERVHGHRRGPEQARRWELAPADDLEVPIPLGDVVLVGADQERE